MAIPFTNREMERAWRENLAASNHADRSNAHRLLLFYAVECGLKATMMRRRGRPVSRTDDFSDLVKAQHNINRLLDDLSADGGLRLPRWIRMSDVKDSRGNSQERQLNAGQINQMWRYGGKSSDGVSDSDLERKLVRICKWIERELR
jgi:hypothetical protein